MHVRLATEADVRAVAFVHVESWRSTYRGLVPDDYLDSLSVERRAEAWRSMVTDAGDDRGVLVLSDGDELVGFCHYSPSRDDDAECRTGEVTSIYLLESHWRKGGGTALLTSAVRALAKAGCWRATLWVLDRNHAARAFYETAGWEHDGAVKLDDRGSFQLRELRYGLDLELR